MVTKWEYTDLWWFVEHTSDRGAMPQVDGDTSQSELLNELGADGWELVSVTAASQIRSQPVIHFTVTFTAGVWYHAFFKRPTQT